MIMQIIAGAMLILIGAALIENIYRIPIKDFPDVILSLVGSISASVVVMYGVAIIYKAAEVQGYVN